MRRFSKLSEIFLEANGNQHKKVSFNTNNENQNDFENVNETFQDMNLTDQLMLSSERHLEFDKSNLLDAEVSNFKSIKDKNCKGKDKLKGKNQGDIGLCIEMKNFGLNSKDESIFGDELSETRIENVDNLAEEIVIKEHKGPILFKIDNYELELIRVWKKIKLGILSICVLAGFLFYVSLPLIISFSKMK